MNIKSPQRKKPKRKEKVLNYKSKKFLLNKKLVIH